MIRLSGLEPGKDIEIVYTGLRPGEKLFEEILHESENLEPPVMKNSFWPIAGRLTGSGLKMNFPA